MRRLSFWLVLGLISLIVSPLLAAGFELAESTTAYKASVALSWNEVALQAVRDSTLGPPMVARALAITHTCIYEAWAPYDTRALGVRFGAELRRPASERTTERIETAISYAAYRCLVDLFPAMRTPLFDPFMRSRGYDPIDNSMDVSTPQGLGNTVAAAILASRRDDGSNQLGLMTPSGIPYADYSGYAPLNMPSTVPVNPATVSHPNNWQPLQYVDVTGTFITQRFLAPFWGSVSPMTLHSGSQFRGLLRVLPVGRVGDGEFVRQAQELLDISANLTDEHKLIAEYWADGPRSETPPGHWNLLAHFVSRRDNHGLDEDVKMFFALNNAVCDAGIAAWDAKRVYDSVRPVTAISYLFAGKSIRSWGGPGRGTVTMDGRDWLPYQASTFPTPPFGEYVSGHSTFSASAATVLALFTHSDAFEASVSFAPGSSSYEPGITPRASVTLRWRTFSAAADQAGISRIYGGIHFRRGDLGGRVLGRVVGWNVWFVSSKLWNGESPRRDPNEAP